MLDLDGINGVLDTNGFLRRGRQYDREAIDRNNIEMRRSAR